MTYFFEPIFALPIPVPLNGLTKGMPFWLVVLLAVGSSIVFVVIQIVFRAVTRKQRKQHEDELWEKNSKKDDNDAP
jgi:hypothetical protein